MKSTVLVEADQPLLGSEAVAARQLANDDRQNLSVKETLENRAPTKLKKKAIAVAIGCWAAVPISISIGAWADHNSVTTIFSSLILAAQSTWIARFWVDDQ